MKLLKIINIFQEKCKWWRNVRAKGKCFKESSECLHVNGSTLNYFPSSPHGAEKKHHHACSQTLLKNKQTILILKRMNAVRRPATVTNLKSYF